MTMKLKIFSWNVRGINEGDKCKIIKTMIRFHLVDLVRLQEAKVQQRTTCLMRSLGVGRCLNWGAVDARGTSRGYFGFLGQSGVRAY